jgi:hypothetical protein
MADIADRAQDDMERDAPYMIAASRKLSGPVACGACHYCGESLPDGVPFCGADCRDDWDAEQRQRSRNGSAR